MTNPAIIPCEAKPPHLYGADVNLHHCIDAAVRFLARRQQAHGEISAHRFFNPQLDGLPLLDSSPFATTFALQALRFIDHPLAHTIRERAVRFLVEEKEGPGLWRYWTSRSGMPIDPDLDDTSCVSFALKTSSAGHGGECDNVGRILANRNADGLFKTWCRADGEPNDVDYVVNANVLLYLGDRAETAAASAALVRLVHEHRESASSHYYVAPLAVHYAIARAYDSGASSLAECRDAVVSRVAPQQASECGEWRDAMSTALAVCTLAAFDAHDEPGYQAGIDHLVESQRGDGGFARAAFYAGPEPPAPHMVYWGSEELTTALCLEAFGRHARHMLASNHSD